MPIHKQGITTAPIKVGDESWIGANAVVVAGIEIGKHCIVAAGSVVTKNVESFSVVAGNPAKVIKKFNHHSGEWERSINNPNLITKSIKRHEYN